MQKYLSLIHIYGGFVSLILFWFPILLKKGSDWHKKIGIAFSISLCFVIVTASVFSIHNLIKQDYPIGLGFMFLSFITTKTLVVGFSAARLKNNLQKANNLIHALDFFIALVSIGMLTLGGILKSYFLLVLGGIGILLVVSWWKNKKDINWKQRHYSGMIFSGVAAYTAFFVIGYNSFFGGTSFDAEGLTLIRWILPAALGILGVKYLNKKYADNKSMNH